MSSSVQVCLQALCSTLSDPDILLFETAVNTFLELDSLFAQLRLLNWRIFVQDDNEIAACIFCIITNLVPLKEQTPDCLECGKNTLFKYDKNRPFGFVYRCVDNRKMSRKQARKRCTSRFICTGVIQTTYNTWLENAKSISKCLGFRFCWTNRVGVTAATEAVSCSRRTAIDHYSMTREVAKVVMLNEVKSLMTTVPLHITVNERIYSS